MNIQQAIASIMKARHVTSLAEFERRAEIPSNLVYTWMKGRTPTRALLDRIESAFDVRIDFRKGAYSVEEISEQGFFQLASGEGPRDISGSTSTTAQEWYMRRFTAPGWESLTDAQRVSIERRFRATQIEEQRIRLKADAAVKQVWMELEIELLRGADPAGDCTGAQ